MSTQVTRLNQKKITSQFPQHLMYTISGLPPIQSPPTPISAPASPTPAPASPTPAPASPTPAPASPTPAPASPTPAPASPTPVSRTGKSRKSNRNKTIKTVIILTYDRETRSCLALVGDKVKKGKIKFEAKSTEGIKGQRGTNLTGAFGQKEVFVRKVSGNSSKSSSRTYNFLHVTDELQKTGVKSLLKTPTTQSTTKKTDGLAQTCLKNIGAWYKNNSSCHGANSQNAYVAGDSSGFCLSAASQFSALSDASTTPLSYVGSLSLFTGFLSFFNAAKLYHEAKDSGDETNKTHTLIKFRLAKGVVEVVNATVKIVHIVLGTLAKTSGLLSIFYIILLGLPILNSWYEGQKIINKLKYKEATIQDLTEFNPRDQEDWSECAKAISKRFNSINNEGSTDNKIKNFHSIIKEEEAKITEIKTKRFDAIFTEKVRESFDEASPGPSLKAMNKKLNLPKLYVVVCVSIAIVTLIGTISTPLGLAPAIVAIGLILSAAMFYADSKALYDGLKESGALKKLDLFGFALTGLATITATVIGVALSKDLGLMILQGVIGVLMLSAQGYTLYSIINKDGANESPDPVTEAAAVAPS